MIEMIVIVVSVTGLMITIVGIAVRNERRFGQINSRLTKLEAKVEPFWAALTKNLPKMFKNPDPRMSNMIANANNLSVSEIEALQKEIEQNLKFASKPKTHKAHVKGLFKHILALGYLEVIKQEKINNVH